MTYIASSNVAGASGTTAAVPVPAGAAAGDVVVIGMYTEMANGAETITFPAGFTIKYDEGANSGTQGRLTVAWKRLTGADTGTYAVSWTTSTWRAVAAGLWRGRLASGDPFDGTAGGQANSGTVGPALSTSPAAAGGDAFHLLTDFAGGATFTPPANFTQRQALGVLALDTRDNIAAGSTGTVQGGASVSAVLKGFLGVLAAAAAGPTATLTFPTVVATGWTAIGGTAQAALADTSDATLITSPTTPTSSPVDVTLQPIETPTGDLTVTVRADRTGGATSASIVATLRDGATVIATAATINPTGTTSDLTATFLAANISGVTQAKWRAGTLVVRLAVTAS